MRLLCDNGDGSAEQAWISRYLHVEVSKASDQATIMVHVYSDKDEFAKKRNSAKKKQRLRVVDIEFGGPTEIDNVINVIGSNNERWRVIVESKDEKDSWMSIKKDMKKSAKESEESVKIKNFIVNISNIFQDELPDPPGAGCFELRAVNLRIFRAVRRLALDINNDYKYWTMGRLSALLIGNHEILKDGNRWATEISDPGTTLTYETKTSLIDLLRLKYSEEKHPLLDVVYLEVTGKRANFFISFAYTNNFIELVDALEVYFEENPDLSETKTFFWFDMFVNNQWEANEHDFYWWATTFSTAVRNIGHTLLFLSPCLDPSLLTRAWCLFEISCSSQISVVLSRNELASFHTILREDVDSVTRSLCHINLERCECFVKADLDRINSAVRAMDGGIDAFNIRIIELIRIWIQKATRRLVADAEEGCETISQLKDLIQSAILLANQGKLSEAKGLYGRVLDRYEKLVGVDHPYTLISVNNFANLLLDMGDLKGSKALYERAVLGYEKIFGVEHPDTITVVSNFGILLQKMGDLKGARVLLENSLNKYEKLLGDNHPSTLNAVNNLGVLLKRMGDFNRAKILYERVLHGFGDLFGQEHPSTLTAANNLAILLQQMGQIDFAKILYERALRGFEKTLGAYHGDTLSAANSLGSILHTLGDLEGAKILYERALHGFEKLVGFDHPDTLNSMNSLGGLLNSMDDLEGAKNVFEDMLSRCERLFGFNHPDTLNVSNNLGVTLKDIGDLHGAKTIFENVLHQREILLGAAHHDTLLTANNLAIVLHTLGEFENAKFLFERVFNGYKELKGMEDEDTLVTIGSLACLYEDMGQLAESKRMYELCIKSMEGVFGKSNHITLYFVHKFEKFLRKHSDEV